MITAEQRELRKHYIGSSDSPAIVGVDPYRSAADVFLEKTGQADGFDGNEHTDRGNLLEPVLIEWFAQHVGRPLRTSGLFVTRTDCGELCANLDAFLPPCDLAPGGAVVECKTSVNRDEWGEAGTDEVPERVIVQTHHAMWMVGPPCRVAFVPVLLPGFRSFDFRVYRVDRNDELADAVAEQCRRFKREHVDALVPPSDFRPSIEVLKRVRREPGKVIPLADDLVDRWIAAKAAEKQAREDREQTEAELVGALRDAEAGSYSRGLVIYMETKRKGYTVEPCAYRSLRLKKAAKE